MINEERDKDDDRATRDDERRRLKAYSKFAKAPAGSIKVDWTEDNQETRGLSKAETCKNVVRTWYKQLKEACSDCTAKTMTDDGDDDDDDVMVIELIDRLMPNTDNPIYTRITTDTTKEVSLSRFKKFDDDDKRNTTYGELKQPTARADRQLSGGNKLTFEDEWIDLVHLKCTREFCLFLKDNPHLMRPDFLVQSGFFGDNHEYTKTMETRKKINSKSSPKRVLQKSKTK